MPTPRSPDVDKRSDERKKAEKLFLESNGKLKLVEIAEKMGLPSNKVRKWKSLDGWEAKLHPDTKKSKKNRWSVPLPKRGALHENEALQRGIRMQLAAGEIQIMNI